MLLPVELIVDRAPRFLTEARVFPGMMQRNVTLSKEVKLVDSESKDPGDISWFNKEGVVVFWDERHVIMVTVSS